MGCWKGQAAVKCLIQSKHLRSWCEKWVWIWLHLPPPMTQKLGCGDHFGQWIPISILSNHSLYQWWDIGRVKLLWIAWIGTNTLYLGVKSRGMGPKFSLPVTHKSGCGDSYTWWIPTLILYDQLSYFWWDIGRVKLLWNAWISPKHTWSWCECGCGPRHICPHSWLKNRLWWPF